MATSKTLAPTNVTISIPAMTDVPDASVFSNCVDKEADAINTLNSQLTNRRSKGTFTTQYQQGVYGFVTTSSTLCQLFIPMIFEVGVSSISITAIKISLRIPTGGYLAGNDFDATSYVNNATLVLAQGGIRVDLVKSDGWGATNNIPVVGTATMSYTIS